jgi:hypothetical protein
MLVLIACEESQTVCKAFRDRGHEAYSNDIIDCSGGHPEYHLKMDVLEAIKLKKWDLGIFHPPCTFVASSSVGWLSHPEDKGLPFDDRRPHPKYPNRRKDMLDSVEFVKALYNTNIKHIAIENPVGLLSSRWRKPDQIVQPYMFGHKETKATCLWLKGLPKLVATDIVDGGERIVYPSGISMPKWYADAWKLSPEERSKVRSKTFLGIAKAMASQWGEDIE